MPRRIKRDVDRYVSQISEREQNARGYQISLLYYEACEYETAKRFLATYISTRDTVPQAHDLMGQILEASNNKEQAISSYRRSLELDGKQKHLVLKICELYSDLKSVDPEKLKYWIEQLERLYPNNPVVFKLKERVMSGANSEVMEDFYAKQLEKNYTDVNLHTKLLDLYLRDDKEGNAYRHTIDVEKTQAFTDNVVWYDNITRVFSAYWEKNSCQTDTSFHTHRLIVLCNLVYLQIKEKDIVSCAKSLHLLDQHLLEAMKVKSQKPEWTSILIEVEGMYYFLCGLLLLKRANKGQLSWKDASSFSLVCFLLSSNYPVINKISSWYTQSKTVQLHKFYDRIHLFGCYRLSQTGYIIMSLMKGDAGAQLNAQKQQLRTVQARDKLYEIMFTMREMREKKLNSYLLQSDSFCTAQITIPSKKLVAENDAGVHDLFADNLHQLVWLALQKYSIKDQAHSDYEMDMYNKFQFSADNIDGSLESLCQLDIQAFFIASVRCASINYEEQQHIGRKDQFRPYILPACLCPSLCTSKQTEWWSAMYKFCTGTAKEDFPKLRSTLQRGLEVIRLQGTHGLSVVAVANIARTFDQRSKDLERNETDQAQDRIRCYDMRSAMYWKKVVEMLDNIERNVIKRLPKERLFDDGDYGLLDTNQIPTVRDQAIFSLATVAMRSGRFEEAKAKFESIETPWASYYLSKIFRDMSDQTNSDDIESEKLTLMERTLDTLYLTLDRLKLHKNHDLEQIVPAEIDDVVNELERLRMPNSALVDSFCNGMNGTSNQQGFVEEEEEDNGSEEEYTSFSTPQGGGERHLLPNPPVGSPSFVASTPAYISRTPSKSPGSRQLHFSMEVNQRARPSPERLEARVWSLEKKQETIIDLVKEMKNQYSDVKQEVKDLKNEYGDLIRQVKELVINQRPQPPQQMYPPPYAGSMYRPPPPHPSHYNYQPTPPMLPQPAYSYPMPMSPGPGGRPIPSRINNRVNQFTPQNDIDDEYCEGEFYEDDGHGMYGPDCSGWTVNHKPPLEGANAMNYSTQGQQMPPAGFFAQALRGQALQFQQGQLITGQAGKQGSPMMTTGMLSMSTTQSVSPGMFPGTQPQTVPGVVPGVFPGTGGQIVQPQPAATVPGMFPVQAQTGAMIPDKVQQGELAGLLATDSTPPKVDSTEKKTPLLSKPSDVQRPIFGTSPSTQAFGNVSSSGNTPNTMPLLSSLMAASTSPDKPLTNPPVTIVTSVAHKGTFTFGQTSSATGIPSPFKFGQVSSTTPGTGVNVFTSPQKNSSMAPGIGANMFSSPPKENIFSGKAISREASPIKSPSKTRDDHIDEYEPNVDFKPVIDLPDLVETKTGEEEEESMFCERAKLFRFDDGQWKERGTGQMKLLRHKETKRVRVLMRRDQVLKICANHFLTKDMKLSPMQSSNKAWCWNAQDFSDGEIQVEKLAVRFKDPDIASRFQSTFEKLQSELDKVVQPKKEQSKPVSTGQQPSLGSLFKKEEGSWKCDACLINNKSDVQKCVSCGTLKPGVKVTDVKQTDTKGHSFNFGASTGGFNIASTAAEQKPSTGSGFTFQSGTKPVSPGGFKFGQTTVTENNKSEAAKPDSTSSAGSGFKFGQQTKTIETDTSKPPLSGGFNFGQLPQTEKNKAEPSGFNFGSTSTTDTKSEQVKQDQAATDSAKSSPFSKPSGFSFVGGPTPTEVSKDKPASPFTFKPNVITKETPTKNDAKDDKPASTFVFKPSAPIATATFKKGTEIAKPEPTKKEDKKGFGDFFKVKEDSWKCDGCLMSNSGDMLKCPACETVKPGLSKQDAKAAGFGGSGSAFGQKGEKGKGFGDLFKPKEGSWKCDGCLMSNSSDVLKCPACEALKPGVKKEDVKDTGKSVFGSGASTISFGEKGGFSFGASSQSDSKSASGFSFTPTTTKDKSNSEPAAGFTPTMSDSERNKPDSKAKGFNFTLEPTKTDTPSKSSSGFNFTLSPTKGGAAGPQSPPTNADGMYVNKDGEDDHIHFEPVIELPSVVDIVTGEEEDDVLFQHRAKLFRFVNREWKERGLGDIKISRNKESGKVRLLMRREQILKICLNHYLSKELELKPMPKTDGKAWIWFAIDFSDNEPEMQQLAIKFKSQEMAANFKKTFDDAKDKLVHADSSEQSPSKITEEKSVPQSPIRTDEIEIICVDEATEDQIKMARKFMLPDHFYLYESVPPCPGCIGCEDYEPGNKCSPPKSKGKEKVDSTANAKPSIFGQSSQLGLFGQKSEGLSTDSRKPGSLFGSSETSVSATDVKGGVFGGGGSEGLSFTSVAKETESPGEGIFGGGGFSFSQLAKQADSSTSPGFKVKDDSKQFTWTGTGQKLFSGGAGDHGDCDASVEDGDESGATYDPHYEPIIDLPDLVDVKTGEEDYDKLFCQRSRLFRFDKEANQWKEKGIGEMKILQHKENRRYRLILRREQVFKIACNQWLTPDISFKPLPTSETSWCWVGQDFSDNEPVIEQLAIKFKTIELAHQFKDTIEECQKELRERNAATTEKGDASEIPSTVALEREMSRNDEEEEEYDDEDDDDDSEEEEILFDKRITFFSKEDDWKAVGLGTLKVIYDEDVNGNRIIIELDNKTVVCNHLVAKESSVVVNKKDCQWSPIDFSTDEPVRRHFRAQFSSEQAALEFQKFVQEGRQLAIESYISETSFVTYPREITFPEVHGGSSQ